MKNHYRLSLLAIFVLLLVSCSNNPIAEDVKTYPAVAKQIVILELSFEKAFKETKDTLQTNPQLAVGELETTLIPKSQELVTLVSNTEPKTAALNKLHHMLTDTIVKRHQALLTLQSAIESKQVEEIQMGVKALEDGIQTFNQQFLEVNKFLEKMRLDNQ